MNVIKIFTKKSLLHHKTWSLVTLIGIIISVSLITGIASLSLSFMTFLRNMEIANHGNWHVQLTSNTNVSDQLLSVTYFDQVAMSQTLGFAIDPRLTDQPYIKISSMNESSIETYMIKISSGRFPKTPNEILLPMEMESMVNINKSISFELGQRMFDGNLLGDQSLYMTDYELLDNDEWSEITETLENTRSKSFIVVGFYESSALSKSYLPFTTLITSGEYDSDIYPYTYSLTFSSLSREFESQTQLALQAIDVQSITYNHGLLRYYGIISNDSLHKVFYGLISIIVLIVMVASVALIYNSFSISLSQRIRQLGMLASIGATKTQIRGHIFLEAFYLFVPSTIIGVFAGVIGIGITLKIIEPFIYNLIGSSARLTLAISLMIILLSILLSLITIIISVWIPALRFSNMSVIDALSERKEIRINQKKLKTPRVITLLFGNEGDLAYKNNLRNRKKFRSTVISLSVSVVLFMSVSYFITNVFYFSSLGYSDINTDLYIQVLNENKEQRKSIINQLSTLNNVDSFQAYSILSGKTKIETLPLLDSASTFMKQLYPNETELNFVIVVMDDDSFKEYSSQLNISDLDFTKNSFDFVLLNQVKHTNYETNSTYFQSIMDEEKVTFQLDFRHTESANMIGQYDASILAFSDELPLGRVFPRFDGLLLITNETSVDEVFNESFLHPSLNSFYYRTEVAIISSMSTELFKTVEDYLDTQSGVRYFANNYESERLQLESIKIIIQIFLYGFITLIALISISNIINTMTTSIQLRKREFAMLKSVGMEPKSFRKMIEFESIFYGLNTLLLSIPLSIIAMYVIRWVITRGFDSAVAFPYTHFIFIFLIVFSIVLVTMSITTNTVMKENMIDAIKNEV